jgi:protein phosphatase
MEDVSGKRIISTRLYRSITIREENASAALEAMSRFAVDPRWLIYLPPTMSPCETSSEEGFLEHPDEAFAYYRKNDVSRVVCEEKHMGSRAVIVVCRDEESARARFGAVGMGSGVCYTRTGRRFFNDGALEEGLMSGLRAAFERSGFWDERKTDWVCLDCEIMPWSVKAQDLLKTQYAAVGISSRLAIAAALDALEQAERAGVGVSGLLERFREKRALAAKFVDAYRQYCWDVSSLSQIKVAPFHLLATEGAVHVDKSHIWHMESLEKIVAGNPDLLVATPYREISPDDEESIKDGAAWWNDLTSRGGEGMVVKPLDFIARGQRGLLQPAVKCRGPEYLRIIYGLEYTMPENLQRLRSRGLSTKRALAMREFALGVEALERFVAREPLRRVHECVFGILALESEPVDPRL